MSALLELADVLDALTPDEQKELDAHLIALDAEQPRTEYQKDPVGWARDILEIPEHTLRWSLNSGYDTHAWDGTFDPIATLYQAIADWEDAGAESGTGTGKSFGVAILVLWFLDCWVNSRVFTFAPKEDQLRLYIWTEIGKLWPKFQARRPDATLTDLCIRMRGGTDDSWGARGYAVGVRAGEDVATKAAGMHAEHMLLIYEETPGIPQAVLEAGENTCTAPHNLRLAIGNPDHRLDALHKFSTSPGVKHIRMSAYDHPNVVCKNANVIPGAVSQEAIDRRKAKYGETSPLFQSRVRGISPEQASDALIRMEWLEASAVRWNARRALNQIPHNITGKGVDVANSEHGDRACIVDFADNMVVRIEAFQCPDSNALGRKVNLEIDAAGLRQICVGIDTIGVGAGTVNELRRLGKKEVQALNASSSPMDSAERAPDGRTYEWAPDANLFKNLRSQMYWQAREDLRLGNIDVPKDDELWEELITPTFVDEPKTIVEPKEEIKDRLGRSPDKADAFVMANWVRKRSVQIEKEEVPQGKSMGYDYVAQKPKERITAEQEFQQMFERAQPKTTAGRYRMPRR